MGDDDKPKRFSFKSDIKFDIALLAEVEQLNPFGFKTQKKIWEDVAKNLLDSNLKMKVTERSCRERTMLLLAEFRKDEYLSQRSSGIDEDDMDSLKKLLTSVMELSKTKTSLSVQKLYSKKTRQEAEKERDEALASIDVDGDAEIELEEIEIEKIERGPTTFGENSSLDETSSPCTSKPKRVRRGDVVDYLEKKHKSELELRKEEIDIRKFEAETRRMEIDMEKKKSEMEFKAKMEELELRKSNDVAQNEERIAMTRALLELLQKK